MTVTAADAPRDYYLFRFALFVHYICLHTYDLTIYYIILIT